MTNAFTLQALGGSFLVSNCPPKLSCKVYLPQTILTIPNAHWNCLLAIIFSIQRRIWSVKSPQRVAELLLHDSL